MTLAAPIATPIAERQPIFPEDDLRVLAYWIRHFSLAWQQEVPIRIHMHQSDAGGGPRFHPDFEAYIDRACPIRSCHDSNCEHGMRSHPPERVRTARAFRRLRTVAPREFDVMYLLCRYGMPISDIARSLNERARRLEKPDHYDQAGILILAMSGADKLRQWC